jgi:hypothetical protein
LLCWLLLLRWLLLLLLLLLLLGRARVCAVVRAVVRSACSCVAHEQARSALLDGTVGYLAESIGCEQAEMLLVDVLEELASAVVGFVARGEWAVELRGGGGWRFCSGGAGGSPVGGCALPGFTVARLC